MNRSWAPDVDSIVGGHERVRRQLLGRNERRGGVRTVAAAIQLSDMAAQRSSLVMYIADQRGAVAISLRTQ